MNILNEIKETLKDAGSTYLILIKILIPISIIVKILSFVGIIEIIGNYLSSTMGIVGLPGEFGFVWATTMAVNIYGGMIVFFQLNLTNTYTVAQVTILGCMMLIAHTLPIEARIAQKAGIRLWFTLSFRILVAFLFGWLLSLIFSSFNLFKENIAIIWKPDTTSQDLSQILLNELRYYVLIFLIILGLIALMRILKKTGTIDKLNNALEPGLETMGISKNVAPITIIGVTLGLSYGGGLILREIKSKLISKKDAFFSLSLMGLSHSLIEDTLLIFSLGASIFGILVGRVLFTIVIMFILIKITNHISKKKFEKYFMN